MNKNSELSHLKAVVQSRKPKTPTDVRNALNDYFSGIVFSVLQDEWNNKMNEQQRENFAVAMFSQIKLSNKTKV